MREERDKMQMFSREENWEVRGIYKSSQNMKKKVKRQKARKEIVGKDGNEMRKMLKGDYLEKRTVTAIKDKIK